MNVVTAELALLYEIGLNELYRKTLVLIGSPFMAPAATLLHCDQS